MLPTDKLSIEVESFKAQRSNTLFGFCTVLIPALHLRIHDLTVHEKNASRWIGLPARPWVDRDGTAKRGDNGKIIYATVLEFTDSGTRNAFSDRAIAALLAKFPHAFDDQTAA
jgi:hypothetical protein